MVRCLICSWWPQRVRKEETGCDQGRQAQQSTTAKDHDTMTCWCLHQSTLPVDTFSTSLHPTIRGAERRGEKALGLDSMDDPRQYRKLENHSRYSIAAREHVISPADIWFSLVFKFEMSTWTLRSVQGNNLVLLLILNRPHR